MTNQDSPDFLEIVKKLDASIRSKDWKSAENLLLNQLFIYSMILNKEDVATEEDLEAISEAVCSIAMMWAGIKSRDPVELEKNIQAAKERRRGLAEDSGIEL